MATHSYIRPGGVWNAGVVVTHGEFQALDAAQVDSISASGGTYAPVAPIIVGGSGMQVLFSGNSHIPAGTQITVDLDGGIFFNGTLQAAGGTYFDNAVSYLGDSVTTVAGPGSFTFLTGSTLTMNVGSTATVNGAFVTITGSVSTFGGSAAFNGTASFNGIASFTSNADFIGPVSIHGGGASLVVSAPTTLSGANTISGATTLSAKMTCSSAGRVVKRLVQISTGTDITAHGPSTADTILVTALSADVTLTINDAGAVDGDEIRIKNLSSSHLLTIDDPVNGTFVALKSLSGFRNCCVVVRAGGAWDVLSQDPVL